MVISADKEARFRTLLISQRRTHSAGLCHYCLREMWSNLPEGKARRGMLAVSVDPGVCESCARFLKEQDGADPRDHKGSPAERVPEEREEDQSWHALAACAGVGGGPFDPDPMPDEEKAPGIWTMRRYVAAFVCADCPVARECRTAARVHGYQGVWGGRFFRRTSWVDPLTGARGPTINTSAPQRRKLIRALLERGLDENGEPLDEEDVA